MRNVGNRNKNNILDFKIRNVIWISNVAEFIVGLINYSLVKVKVHTSVQACFRAVVRFSNLGVLINSNRMPHGLRSTDAQRENSLHCTAETSLPLPNF